MDSTHLCTWRLLAQPPRKGSHSMIKSAASAASPEGFPSHDQVGCQRSLPGRVCKPESRQEGLSRIWKKLGAVIWKLNIKAVIKLAASAADLITA